MTHARNVSRRGLAGAMAALPAILATAPSKAMSLIDPKRGRWRSALAAYDAASDENGAPTMHGGRPIATTGRATSPCNRIAQNGPARR